jgi:hypothetical protein
MSAELVFEFHVFFVEEKICQFFLQVMHVFQDFAFGQTAFGQTSNLAMNQELC